MEHITKKIGGLNVTLIPTDKFKTVDFVLIFRNLLKEENVTYRALIPQVLKAATESYPSKMAISQKLESLYGASVGASVHRQGVLQVLSFRMSVINEAYLNQDVKILEDSFKFFHEIIFKPKLENGGFLEKIVNEEKRLLKEQFAAIYDDKIRYAYQRLIEEMCKTESYRLKAIGKAEDLEKINPNNLYQEYLSLLESDTVEFLIIGDIDVKYTLDLIEQYLPFEKREEVNEVVDRETKDIKDVNRVVEVKEVAQAKLNIGFRTNITGMDDDYYPMLVLNGLLGMYPNSLLFLNVREKESLCYYVSSTIDKGKGIMVIYAGIDKNDYKKAYELCLDQIKLLQEGKFSDADLENIKKALINDLLQISDNPLDYLSSVFSHGLYQDTFDIKKIEREINKVTRADLKRAAKLIVLDTVFLLTNEEVNA